MFRCFYLLLIPSCFAGSYGIKRAPCYGECNVTIEWSDMDIKPGGLNMFFTPSRPGGQKIQVSENGVVLDPRYAFSDDVLTVRCVTERDDGQFSVLLDRGVATDVLRLMIRDCAHEVPVIYGETYSFPLRLYALDARVLDFSPQWYSDEPAARLWAGDPRSVGGHWTMESVTTEHAGYYTFRDENGGYLWRRKMKVTANQLYFAMLPGEAVRIDFKTDGYAADLNYTPLPGPWGQAAGRPLTKNGHTVAGWEAVFGGRMSLQTTRTLLRVAIGDVRPSDAGTFEVRDRRGNVAQRAHLDVQGSDDDSYSYDVDYGALYISMAVTVCVLLALWVVCCLWKKSRQNNSIPLSAVPASEAVAFTDHTTQPSTSAHPGTSRGPAYPPEQPGPSDRQPLAMSVPESSAHGPSPLYPKEPGSTDHLYQAPGPVESSSASGLPVFIHPTTHF